MYQKDNTSYHDQVNFFPEILRLFNPTCKEFESLPLHQLTKNLTDRKVNKSSWIYKRGKDSENCCPWDWRDNRQTGSPSLTEQRLGGKNTWAVFEELLEAQCGQLWELKTPGETSHRGPPHNIFRFASRSQNRLPHKMLKKNPLESLAGRRKRTILKTARSPYSS